MSPPIILRVQSGEHGTIRVSLDFNRVTNELYKQVMDQFSLPPGAWSLFKDRNQKELVKKSSKIKLRDCNLGHGDVLYLLGGGWKDEGGVNGEQPVLAGSRPVSAQSAVFSPSGSSIVEDEVDQILLKMDGKIQRDKHEQLCRHGSTGKCLNCVPLEPFDEEYLKSRDPPIKFLSFHSYIRKLRSGVDKGKFINLENLSCKIKECKEHAPWPDGICTKCQPNAVTLNRQTYRHVDNVLFENSTIVDKFIDAWRESGCQRMGYLLGKYEVNSELPLGIRATVFEIYEPPQVSDRNHIEILEDPHEAVVDELCNCLGLTRVGWILTDLSPDKTKHGAVRHTRGSPDTYFLSSEECIKAAELQNKYPNPCKYSTDGVFGSKFVTVVVTGGEDNQIHMEGYQVSDQCMGLVRDACMVPTYDAPELGYIKESSKEQYVPDVFYKEKDKYGNEVTRLARPLPVEYLLTDMAVSANVEPVYTFSALRLEKPHFPSSNRLGVDALLSLNQYCSRYEDVNPVTFLSSMSDFHLLVCLATLEVYPVKGENLAPLIEAIKSGSHDQAVQWAHMEHWSTLKHFYEAAQGHVGAQGRSVSFVGNNASPLPAIGSTWTCAHCTYINPSHHIDKCDVCGLPK